MSKDAEWTFGRKFLLPMGLAIVFALPLQASDRQEKYKQPNLPKEEAADLAFSYSSEVHVKAIDGAEVSAMSFLHGPVDRHEYLTPGFHTLIVQYMAASSTLRVQSEGTPLLVDLKKGHQYVIVPSYFLDGKPVHFGFDSSTARNELFKEFPYQPSKYPWLDNVYFELYDTTGLPAGDSREKRTGEPDIEWLATPAWVFDYKAPGGRSVPKTFAELDKQVASHPDDLRAHRRRELAELWSPTPDYDRALSEASKVIEIDPHLAQAYFERAFVLMMKNGIDAMFPDLNKAIELKPEFPAALRLRADVWTAKGDAEMAMADYARAIALDACNIWSYHNRGNLWLQKGDLDKALADQDHAIGVSLKFAPALAARGTVWLRKNELDKAIADFNAAIVIDIESSAAYLGRAQAWLAKREYDKAILDCSWAIKINGRNALAYLGRGTGYLMKGDPDKAIPDYDRAVELAPNSMETYFSRGGAWLQKGDFERADRDFAEAQRRAPTNAMISESACSMLANKGDRSRAADDCVKAANIRMAQKDPNKAVLAWNAALTLAPGRADVLQSRAETFVQLGQLDQAIADYRKALTLAPAQADWARRLAELKAMPRPPAATPRPQPPASPGRP
jgi:tetratricopeptide (TPR) repeat protein